MKKTIIIASVSVLAFVVLVKSGIFESLVIFLLAGQIPGTRYAIPSTFMLLAIMSAAWLVIFRFTAADSLHSVQLKRSAKHKTATRKKHTPKQPAKQT